MLNNAKLLLKDFVKQEDLSKLSITHYKLHGQEQPQEEIKEQIEVQVKKQQIEFQVVGRQKIQKYEVPSDQDKISAEHYKQFLQLVNNELQKSSSSVIGAHMNDWNKAEIKLLFQGDPLLLLCQVNQEKHLVDTQVFHGLLLLLIMLRKKIDKLFCFSQIKDPYIQLRTTFNMQLTIIQVIIQYLEVDMI
eukprot:403372304